MAKSKPTTVRNDTLQGTIDALSEALIPAAEAGEALSRARDAASASSETSIRAFVAKAAAINLQLTDDDIEQISEAVANRAYEGKSVKVRKSEIGTLLRQKKHLSRILTGLDKLSADLKAHDDSAKPLNVRQQVIAAARAMRNDTSKTVDEVIGDIRAKVMKAPPTDAEKARALIERLRDQPALHARVGDVTLIDDDADAALNALEALVDGRRPDNPHAEMEEELDTLRARVRELTEELEQLTEIATTQTEEIEASDHSPHDRASEPVTPTTDGDEPGQVSDTVESSRPAPAHSATPAEIKRQATGPSLTGYDIDELLDMSGNTDKNKK